MNALEFETHVSTSGSILVPPEIAKQLHPGQRVRVIVAQDDEDCSWSELTTDEFLKGYDAGDAIYDQLSAD